MCLVDRTGEISLKLWNYSSDAVRGLEPGAFVRVRMCLLRSSTVLYSCHETAQFGGALTLCEPSECNLAEYVPSTVRNVDEMLKESMMLLQASGLSP